jgi:hypothetical protein
VRALVFILLGAGWGDRPAPLGALQTTDLATILAGVGLRQDAAAALQAGEAVSALLPGTPPDEIGIFAAVRVSTSVATFLSRFGDLGVFQRRSAVRISGAVSSPPSLSDFQALPVPASDIAALASCRVGSCPVKLPAAAIEASAGADASVATSVVRDVFLDLANRFLHGGMGALPPYGDKDVPAAPAEGMAPLLAGSTPLLPLVPGLQEDLAIDRAPGSDTELFWLVESFGLRDVLELNAMTARATGRPDVPAIVLTERLYSSHYFVAGYSVSALLVDPAEGGPQAGMYLIFSARYRLDTPLDFLQRHEMEGHLRAYAVDLVTAEKAGLQG